MSVRLVPKSVTLNGEMALLLRYFTEFGSLRGAMQNTPCDDLVIVTLPALKSHVPSENVRVDCVR